MVSTFGWLDTDNEQRRKMLEVVDLFKEEGTVDELGIGSIRDALSDALFPGTSVLQTRLRYVLFIPWLMQRATEGNASSADMSARFRGLEYQLINALTAGGERLGVIGNTAGVKLKRMPSSMYWAAMGTWKVRNGDLSPEGYFRRQYEYRRLANRTARADDPEARELLPNNDLDLHLPAAPAGWLGKTSFALWPEEEQYLSDVIAASTTGSMLAWLIRNRPDNSPDYVWQVDILPDAPEPLRDLIDHARRFHTAIFGAAVLYNLLLARKSSRDELVAEYAAALSLWYQRRGCRGSRGTVYRPALTAYDALHGQRRGPPWERGEIMGAHSIGSEESPVVAGETQSLYERLGGVYAIAVIVDDFIDRIMVDPRLNANPRVDEAHHRVSPQGFKYYVTEQVCWAAGGPQTYSGRTMLDAHRELLITGAEWDAFMDDFHQTLAKFGVPERERAELDAIIESTKDDIVTPAAPAV